MEVLVIGGGPAGMLSAIISKREGNNVTLLEKNEKLGKKLFITGKGRCNVTNFCDLQEFLNNVVTNPKFLYGALNAFSTYDTYSFFEENGTPLKIERGNRVFPNSDKSSDIIKCLESVLNKENITIKLKQTVTDLITKDNTVIGIIANGKKIFADKVILATGGISYPVTGSTGDGFNFAKKVGHTVTKLVGGLNAIICKDDFYPDLAGLSLKNVTLHAYDKEKLFSSEFGELLFTHNGISGPITLTTVSKINKLNPNNIRLFIDFKPALMPETLDKRLLRDFSENINKQFKNSLNDLLPKKLIPYIIKLSGINENKEINQISSKERSILLNLIKNFPITFSKFEDIDRAIITSGGINVKEINPKTMESKIIKNLFFAGEMIDVDALTGGYNIQIAFSTGYLAGKNS